MIPYPPWVRWDVHVVLRGNSRLALAPCAPAKICRLWPIWGFIVCYLFRIVLFTVPQSRGREGGGVLLPLGQIPLSQRLRSPVYLAHAFAASLFL